MKDKIRHLLSAIVAVLTIVVSPISAFADKGTSSIYEESASHRKAVELEPCADTDFGKIVEVRRDNSTHMRTYRVGRGVSYMDLVQRLGRRYIAETGMSLTPQLVKNLNPTRTIEVCLYGEGTSKVRYAVESWNVCTAQGGREMIALMGCRSGQFQLDWTPNVNRTDAVEAPVVTSAPKTEPVVDMDDEQMETRRLTTLAKAQANAAVMDLVVTQINDAAKAAIDAAAKQAQDDLLARELEEATARARYSYERFHAVLNGVIALCLLGMLIFIGVILKRALLSDKLQQDVLDVDSSSNPPAISADVVPGSEKTFEQIAAELDHVASVRAGQRQTLPDVARLGSMVPRSDIPPAFTPMVVTPAHPTVRSAPPPAPSSRADVPTVREPAVRPPRPALAGPDTSKGVGPTFTAVPADLPSPAVRRSPPPPPPPPVSARASLMGVGSQRLPLPVPTAPLPAASSDPESARMLALVQDQRTALQAELERANHAREELERQQARANVEAMARLQAKADELEAAKQRIRELEDRPDPMTDDEVRAKIAALQQERDDALSMIASAQGEQLRAITAATEPLNQTIAELEGALRERETEQRDRERQTERTLGEALEAAERERDEFREEHARTQRRLSEISSELEALRPEAAKLQARVRTLEEQARKFQGSVPREEALRMVREAVSTLEGAKAMLTQQLAAAHRSLEPDVRRLMDERLGYMAREYSKTLDEWLVSTAVLRTHRDRVARGEVIDSDRMKRLEDERARTHARFSNLQRALTGMDLDEFVREVLRVHDGGVTLSAKPEVVPSEPDSDEPTYVLPIPMDPPRPDGSTSPMTVRSLAVMRPPPPTEAEVVEAEPDPDPPGSDGPVASSTIPAADPFQGSATEPVSGDAAPRSPSPSGSPLPRPVIDDAAIDAMIAGLGEHSS